MAKCTHIKQIQDVVPASEGCADFLVKPLDPTVLKGLLQALLPNNDVPFATEQQASSSSSSSQPDIAKSQVVASQSAPAEAPEELSFNLVFFLDPNGGPCKRQNTILQGMSEELNKKVNIRYVSTTVEDQRKLFYHYGIRSLPTLLLADASGKEIKRMTPGIKNVAAIRTFLQSIDKGSI